MSKKHKQQKAYSLGYGEITEDARRIRTIMLWVWGVGTTLIIIFRHQLNWLVTDKADPVLIVLVSAFLFLVTYSFVLDATGNTRYY